MTTPRPKPQKMTTSEAANAFGVTTRTIIAWATKGRLDSVRTLGGHRRFDREQVEALLGKTGPQDDLMAAREIADLFRVEVHTIARWARTGILRAELTPGGRHRYRRAAVEVLARQCGMTPEETPVNDRYRELPYDPDDPDNAELTEEEKRLDEIQARGLRERQADQERAGHRFDILGDDWG